ncbi:MAG: nucleotidyltransferase family protein [Dehalococcoidia bacterium]|nr:nucleotidyltransferase family protein [Dehalococcoidia bacterium]
MRRDETLKILSEHKDDLREKFGVTSIAIFGSTARDEARPDSDVDTLIEIERPAGFFEVARVKFYLEDLLDTKVDLATPGALRAPIRERIYQDLIYVR